MQPIAIHGSNRDSDASRKRDSLCDICESILFLGFRLLLWRWEDACDLELVGKVLINYGISSLSIIQIVNED